MQSRRGSGRERRARPGVCAHVAGTTDRSTQHFQTPAKAHGQLRAGLVFLKHRRLTFTKATTSEKIKSYNVASK